jgi:hypothetical protein
MASLQDAQPRDNGVRRCDGRDDIPRHFYTLVITDRVHGRLISNLDFVGMEKMVERMFEVALTKLSASWSSLSKDNTCAQSVT